MSFYWDNDKKLESNLVVAAQALHNTLEGIRDNLEYIKNIFGAPTNHALGVQRPIVKVMEDISVAISAIKDDVNETLRSEMVERMQTENTTLIAQLEELRAIIKDKLGPEALPEKSGDADIPF
jgi:hypothetical protein